MSDEQVVDNGGVTEAANEVGTALTGGAETPQQQDDLAALFTPEEIEAKRGQLAETRAEEERRAALSDEERAAEDAKRADEEKAGKAPDEYAAFATPDGVTLDPAMVKEFLPVAKELGLTQAQAQKLVDLQVELSNRHTHQQAETIRSWRDSLVSDKEFGGDKYDANLTIAQRALNTIGTQELKDALIHTGMGNHPEIMRLFYRIGCKMQEDSLVRPDTAPAKPEGRVFNYNNTK